MSMNGKGYKRPGYQFEHPPEDSIYREDSADKTALTTTPIYKVSKKRSKGSTRHDKSSKDNKVSLTAKALNVKNMLNVKNELNVNNPHPLSHIPKQDKLIGTSASARGMYQYLQDILSCYPDFWAYSF